MGFIVITMQTTIKKENILHIGNQNEAVLPPVENEHDAACREYCAEHNLPLPERLCDRELDCLKCTREECEEAE